MGGPGKLTRQKGSLAEDNEREQPGTWAVVTRVAGAKVKRKHAKYGRIPKPGRNGTRGQGPASDP